MPPGTRRVSGFSATVNSSKGIWSSWEPPRSGTITSWNTSHGPAKSITVTPSEIANATGIFPFAGGVSLLFASAIEAGGRNSRVSDPGRDAPAMTTPKLAVWFINSLLFIFSST